MKRSLMACAALALALSGCGPAPGNDPVYQALKANPPTTIPARHLPKLRKGRFSCDVHDEGKASQYMTCWWPQSFRPTRNAYLAYYGPSILRPPQPSIITVPGGELVIENVPVH